MSEQTIQNDLYSNPVTILDKYTCYNLGATTIKSLIDSGHLNIRNHGIRFGNKPDVLVVDKNKQCVVFIELKQPSEFRTEEQKKKAINQEIDVAISIGAKIFIATDGEEFIWINPQTKNRITNPDGTFVSKKFKPKDEQRKLLGFIDNILFSISNTNDQILEYEDIDPTDLAERIAGILKRMTFASSKMSLYTFVEVFLFKYLSDIGILTNMNSFDYIFSQYQNEVKTDADVLFEYFNAPRKTMERFFPEGRDGTSIINGKVFHVSESPNEDGHYISEDGTDSTFRRILEEFKDYERKNGKFINISKDFKSKLFETFMKKSDDKSEMGQFFTPLKVVDEMVRMVDVKPGDRICDPACGVGKFLLEAVSQNQEIFDMYRIEERQWNDGYVGPTLVTPVELFGFEKMMSGRDDITTILAKANTLIYFSNLYKNNNERESIENISLKLLNDVFYSSKTQLGTLSNLKEKEYSLILANPPYYRDGEISRLATATGLYSANGQGIEGLFLEWIIKSLQENGTANVVLPDGIFTNIANEKLKQFIIDSCNIEAIISLPINTFFNTPKKTYIMCLKKKPDLNIGQNQKDKVFCYICSSIGESLDVYRWDIEDNDLHEAVNKYNGYRSLTDKNNIFEPYKTWFEEDKRMKLVDIEVFSPSENWNIDNLWTEDEKIELGIKKATNTMSVFELQNYIDELINDMNEYKEELEWLK